MLPRLYRQAPLNSIWEGSGNVQCLDVLRALQREPETRVALLTELQQVAGRSDVYDQSLQALLGRLQGAELLQADARTLVVDIAVMLQAAMLLCADSPLAQAFVCSRLRRSQAVYGQLQADTPFADILARALPMAAAAGAA